MKKELLFSFSSPSRDDLNVYGYKFGNEKSDKKIAIVSGLNGEEISGVFACSQLIRFLNEKSVHNPDFVNCEILIIPSVNHFALNMGKRFWPLDNTDINVMFPGYDKGETTQRIAHKLFEVLKEYEYGVILEDRKDKANCLPYIKLIKTGYEDIDGAKEFGLPFVHTKEFEPIDSGSLLYNLGVWNTKAYSIVFGSKNNIFKDDATMVIDSLIRFLSSKNAINFSIFGGNTSSLINRDNIEVIKAKTAGIFKPNIKPSTRVKQGDVLGIIYDSMTGETKEKIVSCVDGVVTCLYSYPLIFEHTVAFRIARFDTI
ncbi:MAG: M14 family metallopeptidase [Campylobacterota bacterium]